MKVGDPRQPFRQVARVLQELRDLMGETEPVRSLRFDPPGQAAQLEDRLHRARGAVQAAAEAIGGGRLEFISNIVERVASYELATAYVDRALEYLDRCDLAILGVAINCSLWAGVADDVVARNLDIPTDSSIVAELLHKGLSRPFRQMERLGLRLQELAHLADIASHLTPPGVAAQPPAITAAPAHVIDTAPTYSKPLTIAQVARVLGWGRNGVADRLEKNGYRFVRTDGTKGGIVLVLDDLPDYARRKLTPPGW